MKNLKLISIVAGALALQAFVQPASAQMVGPVVSVENAVLKSYLDHSFYDITDYSYTFMDMYVPDAYGVYDKPEPVTFRWDQSDFWKEVQLEIYGGKFDKIPIIRVIRPTLDLSFKVYNLIPGKEYYYSFMAKNGSSFLPIEEGSFLVEGRRRMIKADFMTNIRDFGGLLTEDGKMLKYGRLFRGAAMDHARRGERDTLVTADGIAVLHDFLGIRADIDLRGAKELMLTDKDPENDMTSSILGPDVEYYNFRISDFGAITSSYMYGDAIAAIVDCLERGLNVYIHCAAGADRTGVLSFLLGAMAGVCENDLAHDYELTCLAHGKKASHSRNSEGRYNYAPSVEYIKENYSGRTFAEKIQNYLIAKHGVTRKQIASFRYIMVDAPDNDDDKPNSIRP